MRACTERQRLFVLNLLEYGDDNFTRAAQAAGYSDPGAHSNTIHSTAYRLAHDPRVQEAYQEESKKRLNSGLILATSSLVQHVKSADAKVSLKAIEMILNRGGLHAQSEHKVTVAHTLTDEEIVANTIMMARAMGIDPALMLGQAGYKMPAIEDHSGQAMPEVVDAEFEEIKNDLDDLEAIL